MHHLLRNKKSKEYFDHGRWTVDPEQAQHFGNSETAIAVAIQCRLSNVELVQPGVEASESEEICFPVPPQKANPSILSDRRTLTVL